MKLDFENVSKSHFNTKILKEITLSIPECKTLAFIGPSGGGKSTLLRMIAGVVVPDEGQILFNGSPIPKEEDGLLKHRRSLGTVFQSWNLFPHLTAIENICLPLYRVHGFTQKEAADRAKELLERFGLAAKADSRINELSGGESQRIAIIRAVAIQPKVLLFDEPTSALDPIMTSEVLDLIVELKENGSDLILISHHLLFTQKIADYIAFVSGGRIIEVTASALFFSNPTQVETKAFLDKVLKY